MRGLQAGLLQREMSSASAAGIQLTLRLSPQAHVCKADCIGLFALHFWLPPPRGHREEGICSMLHNMQLVLLLCQKWMHGGTSC